MPHCLTLCLTIWSRRDREDMSEYEQLTEGYEDGRS